MAISRALMGLALGISLSAVATHAYGDQAGTAIVAEVDGQKLTRADLEQKQVAKLLQARYQQYLAEREALDQLIDQQLVEMQATREHLSVEQLVQRDVISQVKDPTDDQIQVFYEGMRTEEAFAVAREKIIGRVMARL